MHHQVKATGIAVDLARIPLQYITDYKEGVSIPEQVEAVCRGGCRWVQLRMKEATREEFTRRRANREGDLPASRGPVPR